MDELRIPKSGRNGSSSTLCRSDFLRGFRCGDFRDGSFSALDAPAAKQRFQSGRDNQRGKLREVYVRIGSRLLHADTGNTDCSRRDAFLRELNRGNGRTMQPWASATVPWLACSTNADASTTRSALFRGMVHRVWSTRYPILARQDC